MKILNTRDDKGVINKIEVVDKNGEPFDQRGCHLYNVLMECQLKNIGLDGVELGKTGWFKKDGRLILLDKECWWPVGTKIKTAYSQDTETLRIEVIFPAKEGEKILQFVETDLSYEVTADDILECFDLYNEERAGMSVGLRKHGELAGESLRDFIVRALMEKTPPLKRAVGKQGLIVMKRGFSPF